MKKRCLQCITVFISLWIAVAAFAGDFKNVVLFGDSSSDSGNIYAVSESAYPSWQNYEGRFSNGPVWIEYLIDSIGLPGIYANYAHGGAQTGYTNVSGDFPGFLSQIEAYTEQLEIAKTYPKAFAMPEETLFIVTIGGNDFWSVTDPAATISQAVGNIQTGMTALLQAGATQFVVMNVLDYGLLPQFNKDGVVAAQVTQLIGGFNQALEQLLGGLESMNPELEITRLDAFSFLRDIVSDYEAFGFTNAVDGQLDKEQGTVREGVYLFWEDVHPTTTTHKLVAEWAADQIVCDTCKEMRQPYFEEGLTITVPRIELDDNAYSFKMLQYVNPDDEGLFWKLDWSSLTTVE